MLAQVSYGERKISSMSSESTYQSSDRTTAIHPRPGLVALKSLSRNQQKLRTSAEMFRMATYVSPRYIGIVPVIAT